jgi:hypothetical protein
LFFFSTLARRTVFSLLKEALSLYFSPLISPFESKRCRHAKNLQQPLEPFCLNLSLSYMARRTFSLKWHLQASCMACSYGAIISVYLREIFLKKSSMAHDYPTAGSSRPGFAGQRGSSRVAALMTMEDATRIWMAPLLPAETRLVAGVCPCSVFRGQLGSGFSTRSLQRLEVQEFTFELDAHLLLD